MTGGSGQHSTQMTGGSGQHPTQMTGGSGQHSTQMTGGSGQHPTQMTGGSGQHSTQMTGGSGQHPTQMTGGSGQHSTQMTGGSGQHSTQMTGGSGQHSTQMTGGSGQHSTQMTGGSGQHSTQMTGGSGQHSTQMTGGSGQHSTQVPGQSGKHTTQMTGGSGQHSTQMTGGPGQHSSQMPGGPGQHSSQMTGGPGQHSSQMPGGPGQHSSQMPGGSGQHSTQMTGGPGQHSSQMTGGSGQHSSQMTGGPGQHSSQMTGGPGQHSSQMTGGSGQHSSQMTGGPGQHSSQMTGGSGQHSSQMTGGPGQHSSQMTGGSGQHSSQMPGGPGQHSSQMPGGPGQHSSQMPGGPGQHTTQMLGGPEQRTSQHITQYRAQLSGGPNYHGDKDMVGKQIALPESDPIVELLRKNERLRDKITISLLYKGIQIDEEDIKRGVIAVKQGNENSLQTVYKVLQEYVKMHHFPDTVVEENLSKDDFSFLDKDLSIFCHHVVNGQMWTLVHSTDIFERLQPVLWKLWYKEIKIPLPGYLLSHVPVFKNKLQGWVECNLTEEDGQGYLTVSVEQTRAKTVKEDIFCWLETLMFRQQPVCKTTGHILQSRAQSEWMKSMQNTQDSTILVQTPDRHVLLHAWSPNGHQLILCVDDMKEPDADLMVIPLSHEQKEWSTNKPFLNTAFESTPSEMKTLVLHLTISSGQLKDKKVALLRVPSNRDNKLKDKIWTALKEVLKSTASNTTVAIPLHMIPNSDVGKSAKVILHGIVESLQEGLGPTQGLVLKLYLEPGMMTDDLDFVNFDEHLTKNNWITSGSLKTRGTSCDRVRVVVEDFLKLQADVFVNSTDPQLNHVHGTVSKLLLKKAGQALEQQCHQLYRRGMAGNVVAVSDSFGAKNVKKIFHIALPQDLWPEQVWLFHLSESLQT
ncbi:uncharacterized protein [Littorina saxatilis]|uniref:uncharacterized protein n=1 Tax=Littorina saxatilis TaxID=31220 RepID=UPI0038B53E44